MAMNYYYDEVWGETVVNMDGLRKITWQEIARLHREGYIMNYPHLR